MQQFPYFQWQVHDHINVMPMGSSTTVRPDKKNCKHDNLEYNVNYRYSIRQCHSWLWVKQEKVVRWIGVDNTHKLTIASHSNCHVQLRSLKGIGIITNSRQQWIKRNTHEVALQTLPRGSSCCFLELLLVR